uniref:Uncharacterized protein n=1 Tax=Cucumis melo TaxID=3656 RepID=A0A9I9CNW5_CUCME
MGIGEVSAEDGSDPNSCSPVGDIVRGLESSLMELIRQVSNKIGGDAVVCGPLEYFVNDDEEAGGPTASV